MLCMPYAAWALGGFGWEMGIGTYGVGNYRVVGRLGILNCQIYMVAGEGGKVVFRSLCLSGDLAGV